MELVPLIAIKLTSISPKLSYLTKLYLAEMKVIDIKSKFWLFVITLSRQSLYYLQVVSDTLLLLLLFNYYSETSIKRTPAGPSQVVKIAHVC